MPTTSSAEVGVDQEPLQPGINEELAGPSHLQVAPVVSSERISSVDALRGFALLGILIANLPAFAYPPFLGLFPIAMVHPVFSGPHHAVNTAIWFFRWIVAEGKMRALFSMLFGAGCILLTERAEARGAGVRTADIYLRRNLWLAAFGIFHCFLIWHGDILFFYGLTGLIFLFPFRNLKANTLLWCSVAVVLVAMTCGVQARWSVFTVLHEHRMVEEANTAVAHHEQRNAAQMQAIVNETQRNRHQPNLSMTYQSIAEYQQDYLATRLAEAPENYEYETKIYFLLLPDTLSMMLFGMALYKVGFLSGSLTLRSYAITALVGLGISWPLLAWESWFALQHQFSPWGKVPMQITYDFGRISGALGYAALVTVLMKQGIFRPLFLPLAAVCQLALSNYLLTSILMQYVFVWGPLHWYGYLEYYQAYAVMLGMWAISLIASPLWLRYFRFGPVEWLWRSLTYWKRQPMRLTS